MQSCMQSCIALSTMKAEHVAYTITVHEAVWLRRFLRHLDVASRANVQVEIFSDNLVALKYVKDPKYHGGAKQINIQFYYIPDMIKLGKVFLWHISTTRMVANPLTKLIAKNVFKIHVK